MKTTESPSRQKCQMDMQEAEVLTVCHVYQLFTTIHLKISF